MFWIGFLILIIDEVLKASKQPNWEDPVQPDQNATNEKIQVIRQVKCPPQEKRFVIVPGDHLEWELINYH